MNGLVLKIIFLFFGLDYFTFMVFLLLGNAAISSIKARKDEDGKKMRLDSSKKPGQFYENEGRPNHAKRRGILSDR